jgi:predicted phage terminase large subunit-like protein
MTGPPGEPRPLELLSAYQPLFDPAPAWRYAFLTGGRGGGKSFHIALFLLNLTYEAGHVILFTRWTMVAASISIIPEFVDKIDLLGLADDFDVTRDTIRNRRTGSAILFRGIKTSSGNQSARLKSIKGVTTWVLDEAEELVDAKSFDTIDYSIRQVDRPNRVVLVLNPAARTHFLYERFVAQPRADTLYVHTTYEQNAHNLSPSFIEQAERLRDTNPQRYRHVFLGEWTHATEGLLWTGADIVRARVEQAPDNFARVLVGVDPAVTANTASNETGIVVVGLGRDKRGYVLEDLSGRYSPAQWGAVAIDAARRWGGSIVAEVNQGGDMVRSVLAAQGDKAHGVRIVDVRATKGKLARAEPVYALYQEGRVFHVGQLPILEQQMSSFRPDAMDGSPDRVDALVWALSSLMLKQVEAFVV